ncbi:hypothetical protein MBLNU459_g4331t1 [Dothideomycetes sp. NU459]
MSLARAFTTRRKNSEGNSGGLLGRYASQRSPTKPSISRVQISKPVALISTTNNLCYDAPNIAGTTPIASNRDFSSGSSVGSSAADDSDASSASVRSRDTYTDASSVDECPTSPEPNHLSCYFKPSVYTDVSRSNSVRTSSTRASFDAPTVPQRAASHSKKAHVTVSRQRSVARLHTPPSSAKEVVRDSADFFRASPAHPFGKELEQLNEVAEEFGSVVRDAEADADRAFMDIHGLGQFSAVDYMTEISDLLNTVFEDEYEAVELGGWI